MGAISLKLPEEVTGATHSSKFRVRSSKNLELRTSNRRPSRQSRFSESRSKSRYASRLIFHA